MLSSVIQPVRAWLPEGNTLSDETFASRNRFLRGVLLAHLPPLFVWGVIVGNGVAHAALEVVVPAACWVAAGMSHRRRMTAWLVTAGLVWCSVVIVHLSGGTIEAHFHFFIVIPFVTLYQDWPPFLWAVAFTVLSHGIGSTFRPDLMFNHQDAIARPWTWSLIHGVAVAFAAAGAVSFWRAAELEQRRAAALAADLATQREQAHAQEAGHRSLSHLLVTLARRNQNLVERQLRFIEQLEQHEQDEHMLANLFRLDHLATRMRRSGDSLIVLSGAEAAPRLAQPLPVSEVIRGAVAEIEDYQRVDVAVQSDPLLAGRAVAGIAHLLAELIENAAVFSPNTAPVSVVGRSLADESYQIAVIDAGLGMSAEELAEANIRLADPPDVDAEAVRMLGLHVVARLAARHGVSVYLQANEHGGVTALVRIPARLRAEGPGDPARPGPSPVAVEASVPPVARAQVTLPWLEAPPPPHAVPALDTEPQALPPPLAPTLAARRVEPPGEWTPDVTAAGLQRRRPRPEPMDAPTAPLDNLVVDGLPADAPQGIRGLSNFQLGVLRARDLVGDRGDEGDDGRVGFGDERAPIGSDDRRV